MGRQLLSTVSSKYFGSAVEAKAVFFNRHVSPSIGLPPLPGFRMPYRTTTLRLHGQRPACRTAPARVPLIGKAVSRLAEEARVEINSSNSNGSSSTGVENAVLQSLWEGEGVEVEDGSFDWLTSWYPVGISAHLDKKRPYQVTVLGRQYVVWWDRNASEGGAEGKWQVFADLCPHRLAPLSEGRIHESGALQCSYHGWTFRGDASCSSIPQALPNSPPVHERARACAIRHPSVEKYGFIWMMPSAGPRAWKRAAASAPPVIPPLEDPDFVWESGMRDLAYGYDTLVENVLDPSHVPYAHHGIQGNRNKPRMFTLSLEQSSAFGFSGQTGLGNATFQAPCTYAQQIKVPGKAEQGWQIYLIVLAVPTMPGHSRVFFAFPQNFLKQLRFLRPHWLDHITNRLKVLDSDLYILHYQERAAEAIPDLKKRVSAYYMPTIADSFVGAFRVWYETHAGGSPSWAPGVDTRLPPALPKEVLLNRYNSHVVHCPSCSGAHENFKRLKTVLQVAAFAILAALVTDTAMQTSFISSSFTLPLLLGAGGMLLLTKWVDSVLELFHFKDYIHAYVK